MPIIDITIMKKADNESIIIGILPNGSFAFMITDSVFPDIKIFVDIVTNSIVAILHKNVIIFVLISFFTKSEIKLENIIIKIE